MLPSYVVDFFSQHQDLLWIITVVVDLSITLILYRSFGKMGLYAIIILNIMLSNIQGPKLTIIFGMQTSLGLILYAGIYFATDLLSEKYGKREANRAVMLGFATSIVIVIMMSVSLMFLPSQEPGQREFAESVHGSLLLLFDFTPHFVFGSLFVYLVSQSFDVWAFHYIKEKTKGKHLWLRNNLSTITSQAIDTVLYTLIVWWAFFDLETAFQLALAKYFFKVLIAAVDTPFIYLARNWNVTERDWWYITKHHEHEQKLEHIEHTDHITTHHNDNDDDNNKSAPK